MINKKRKCRLGVFWISGIALVLITLAVATKLIFKGKLKVGKYGE